MTSVLHRYRSRILVEDTSELMVLYESSTRSIGQLLIPDTLLEAVGPLCPRDTGSCGPDSEARLHRVGSYEWIMDRLASLASYVVGPAEYCPVSSSHSIIDPYSPKQRIRANGFVFHVPYWVLFGAIVAGNYIIHERYRVMATLLLWGCIWLGISGPKRLIRLSYLIWFVILGAGAIFYLAYKSFPK